MQTLMGLGLWPGVILLVILIYLHLYLILDKVIPSSKLRKLLCGGPNTNVDNLGQDIGYN